MYIMKLYFVVATTFDDDEDPADVQFVEGPFTSFEAAHTAKKGRRMTSSSGTLPPRLT